MTASRRGDGIVLMVPCGALWCHRELGTPHGWPGSYRNVRLWENRSLESHDRRDNQSFYTVLPE